MLNKPSFNPATRLRELRERAGYSRDRLAPLIDFAAGSSVQRYELGRNFGDKFLPLELVIKLIPIFEGRGDPPILRSEIVEMAGVNTIVDTEHDNHFEKTFKAADAMLRALIRNGFLELSPDKLTPIALGIARRAADIEPQSAQEYDDVIRYIKDLDKISK